MSNRDEGTSKRGRAQAKDRRLRPVARCQVFGAAGDGVEIRQIRLKRIRDFRTCRGRDWRSLDMSEIPRVSPKIVDTRQQVPDRLIVAAIDEVPHEISERVGAACSRPAHAMLRKSARICIRIAMFSDEVSKAAMSETEASRAFQQMALHGCQGVPQRRADNLFGTPTR